MHETIDKSSKEWRAYNMHRISSHKRRTDRNGNLIEFRLSFEQWCAIWHASGKFDMRGRRNSCYCMARHNDIGHYEVGNVSIITQGENHSQAHKGKRNHNAKFTEDDIRDIRTLYSTGNYSLGNIADKYKVSKSNICHITTRRTWKHVA